MGEPLKKNVAANLVSATWTAALGLVCIPIYLKYLGLEAYGLVGFFAAIMALLGVTDLGLATTVNRALARLSATPGSISEQRDLLRTLELIYWTVAITIGLLTFAFAGESVANWIHPQHLSRVAVESAVRLMGVAAGLQLPFGLYRAGLAGLQRQVLLNVVLLVFGTLRTAGAVLILAFVSPTIEAFYAWQAIVMILQLAIIVSATWRSVAGPTTPRFRSSMLRDEWRFATAVSANAIIGVFLTQADRVLLSGFLPLVDFAYYVLAGNVASSLWLLIVPINAALFPRFTQLLERRDESAVKVLYHTACQLVAVVILPIAGTLAFFSRSVLLAWTRHPLAAQHAAALVTLLVTATALNGLASVPSYFQSAAGWPQLMMYTNLAAALLFVPSIVPIVEHLGAVGAASAWLLLNLSYVLVTVPLMHRRLLKGEARRWFVEDVLTPAGATVIVAAIARLGMPARLGVAAAFWYVALAFVAMALATLLALPRARMALLRMFDQRQEAIA